MKQLTLDDTQLVVTRIADFSDAWNENDLGLLSKFIADDVSYSNPPISFGVFNLPGKEVVGRFNVLKFWKRFFKRYEVTHEEKEVLNVEYDRHTYIVSCNVHNYDFGVSSKSIFCLNNDLLINKIEFLYITKLKEEKEISVLALLVMQIKNKILN